MNKKFKKSVEKIILPPILFVFVGLLYLTCKKRFHILGKKADDVSTLFVFWHGELLMLPFAYKRYRASSNIDTIVSEHHDGEIATRFLKYLGGGTIRGSSTRGGAKALKGAFTSIKKNRDIGITPDGPKGPRYSVADGAVILAQKKDLPIVAMNCRASKAWRMKSWDRFFIPKPFSTLDFYFSEPFDVGECQSDEAKNIIKERLMKHAF